MKYLIPLMAATALAGCDAGTGGNSETLEARVVAMEDHHHINRLVGVDYARALDAFDAETYAALFTQDGVLDLVGNEFSGQAEIKGMFENPASMLPPPEPGEAPAPPMEMPELAPGQILVQHVVTNMDYTIDGETASGRSYFQEITNVDGRSQIINTGHYDDELVKIDGTWKFAKRSIRQDFPPAQ